MNAPTLPITIPAPHFEIPIADLRQPLAAVSLACSNDETRPALNSVLLRMAGTSLTVVATNGRWLAKWPLEIKTPAAQDGDIVVPLDVAKEILRVTKKLEGSLSFTPDTCDHRSFSFRWDPIPAANFPPYNQVIPAPSKKQATGIALAGPLLAQIAKAFKIAVAEFFYCEVTGATEPIVCSNPATPLLVVLMPCLMDRHPSRVLA